MEKQNTKTPLADFGSDELDAVLKELNQPGYRTRQVYKHVHSGTDYDGMTDIPKPLREALWKRFAARALEIEAERRGKDGVVKYLYRLLDGNLVEGVLMPYKHGNTLCVSTQVGCRMGCVFCASGADGLKRNLSAGEILGQILCVNAHLDGNAETRKITNAVLMGSGEPLDNYDNVAKFLRLVSAPDGICISQRNISLSTCGIADKITRLADDGFKVTLTVSLHATTDEGRKKLIPAAKKYTVADIVAAAKKYFDATGRRVIFEYALISGENDSDGDAARLAGLVKGFPAHVNLILLNDIGGGFGSTPHPASKNAAAARKNAQRFLDALTKRGVSATLRRSLGADIEGACGQLRVKFVGGRG